METKQIKTFKDTDTFLSISVYRFPLGNCGGITDTLGKEFIYIPCETGPYKFSEIEDKNRVFIEEQRGVDYWALKPLIQPIGVAGPMSGGNLAYSSDSRCKHVYHIHDRFETWEAYKTLST